MARKNDFIKVTKDYISESDWRIRENSSVQYTLGGLILAQAGAVSAEYWLEEVYPKKTAEAHRECKIHIHDLSLLTAYCAGWGLKDLLDKGLYGAEGKTSCGPAKHLSVACLQIVNFLGIMQNEWAGAQAINGCDTFLSPFIKKDNLSEKEVKQAIQGLLFGLNMPSRWGSQAPFTNITIDFNCPEDLKNQKAKIAGEEMDFTYGECQKEIDLFNKVLFETYLEGDYKGFGFEYPIPTISITKDFNWDHPNCEYLFKLAAKFGSPYFQNFIHGDIEPSDVRSMCCLHPDTLINCELQEDIVEYLDDEGDKHFICYKEALRKGII
jgi:ribonucleoside-triphosphate reductase